MNNILLTLPLVRNYLYAFYLEINNNELLLNILINLTDKKK